jgi:hypothetical protein
MSVHSQLGGGGGCGGFGVWGGGGSSPLPQNPYKKHTLRWSNFSSQSCCAGATSPHNHVASEQLLLTIMLCRSNFDVKRSHSTSYVPSLADLDYHINTIDEHAINVRARSEGCMDSLPISKKEALSHLDTLASFRGGADTTQFVRARRRPYLTWTPSQASAAVQTQHSL